MIVLVNEKQSEKKAFKGVGRIFISSEVQGRKKSDINVRSLVPDSGLYVQYLNGQISKKKFDKKYLSSIEKSDDAYSILLLILSRYVKDGNLLFVCSDDEIQFGYMQALLEYIHDKFKVEICSYKVFKKRDLSFKKKIKKFNSKIFLKELKAYREYMFDSMKDYRDTVKAFSKKLSVKVKAEKKISKKKKGKIEDKMATKASDRLFIEQLSKDRVYKFRVKTQENGVSW